MTEWGADPTDTGSAPQKLCSEWRDPDEEEGQFTAAAAVVWDDAFLLRFTRAALQEPALLGGRAGERAGERAARARRRACAALGFGVRALPAAAAHYRRLYRDTACALQVQHGAGWLERAPPWLREAGRLLPAPDPALRLLDWLTARARRLRTVRVTRVCRRPPRWAALSARALRGVWARAVRAARAKLDALVAGGDAGARLSAAEWRLADALLLHGARGTVQAEHARRAEPLRALVACFHLVQAFRLEEGEEAGGWRAAAAAYRARGYHASAVLLQRRWHELKALARRALGDAAQGADWDVAPLLAAVARRYPRAVTAPAAGWRALVARRAVLEGCELTEGAADEEEAEAEGPPPPEAEDDLILVEQEIETVELDAEPEAGAVRAALERRRHSMAARLQDELERQLRDLGEPEPPPRAPHHDPPDDTLNIDLKLLMETRVQLVRVDDPAWRDAAPPRKRARLAEEPAERAIKVEIKLEPEEEPEPAEKAKEPEREERGRKRVCLPDIAEVRRSQQAMLTAQVAPLAAPPAHHDHDDDDDDASSASSDDAALCIDEDARAEEETEEEEEEEEEVEREEEEDGVPMSARQLAVVLARVAQAPRSTDSSWRARYCCAARYHRALNAARARHRARAARPPAPPAPVHAARCAPPCACCCRHLLEDAPPPPDLRAALLAHVRAVLGARGEPPAPAPPAPAARPARRRPPPRRKKPPPPAPPPEPAGDPLDEWIRQRNINSQYFDLHLKRPPRPAPAPAPAPAPPARPLVFTKQRIISVQHETPPGPLRPAAADEPAPAPAPPTPPARPAPAESSPPADVIDLTDKESPPPSPAPAPPAPGGIRVRPWAAAPDPRVPPPGPAPGPRAPPPDLLSRLPAGIVVRAAGPQPVAAGPCPVRPLILNCAPQARPPHKAKDIKVFKISADGRLYPAAPPAAPPPAGTASKEAHKIVTLPKQQRQTSKLTKSEGDKTGEEKTPSPVPPKNTRSLLRPLTAPPASAGPPAPAGPARIQPVAARTPGGRRVLVIKRKLGAGAPSVVITAASLTRVPANTPPTTPAETTPAIPGGSPLAPLKDGVLGGSLAPEERPASEAAIPAGEDESEPSDLEEEELVPAENDDYCVFDVEPASPGAPGPPGPAGRRLGGGAVVSPLAVTYDLTDLSAEAEAALVGARRAEVVLVADRRAPPYCALGRYLVASSRALRCARAAVWRWQRAERAVRLRLRAAPRRLLAAARTFLEFRTERGAVRLRAEFLCRSAAEVAEEARGGARLRVVCARSGASSELQPVRAARPTHLALRCSFLDAAREITREVNLAACSGPRIAPKPPGLRVLAPRPHPPPPVLVALAAPPPRRAKVADILSEHEPQDANETLKPEPKEDPPHETGDTPHETGDPLHETGDPPHETGDPPHEFLPPKKEPVGTWNVKEEDEDEEEMLYAVGGTGGDPDDDNT